MRYFPALLPETTDEDPEAVLAAGRGAAAAGAAAAQRHRLPLEPADLRHRRRPPAPAGREPGAAGRPDRRRRAGQRGLLLRRACRMLAARRPAGLDQDELRRGRAQLPRRAPAGGIDVAALLARLRRGPRPTSWCCATCCRWPTRGWSEWGVSAAVRDRYLGGHRGPLHDRARNGAAWQIGTVAALRGARAWTGDARSRQMLELYAEGMHSQRAGAHLAGALSGSPEVHRQRAAARPGDRCRGGGLS